MSRHSADPIHRQAVGIRLKVFIEGYLMTPISQLAQEMGYATDSTLRLAVQGKTYLGTDKLNALFLLSKQKGTPINVNWLISGIGEPVLPFSTERSTVESELILAIKMIDPKIAKNLLSNLSSIIGERE